MLLDNKIIIKSAVSFVLSDICLAKLMFLRFLVRTLLEGDSTFQNSEYEVHQIGPKNYGSQNYSFLAFMGLS
jgi:hypothetical protein